MRFNDRISSGAFSNLLAVLIVFTVSFPAAGGVDWVGVPVDPLAPMQFENAANWQSDVYDPPPPNPPGPELVPPGPDSTWFMEGFDGIVTWTQPRTGLDGTTKIGAGAIGGGGGNEVQTLIISTDVTVTGLERDSAGLVKSDTREFRVGRTDTTEADSNFPWGVVKQTTGNVLFEYSTVPTDSDLKLSSDKRYSAGSIWEVGGDASLTLLDDILIGDKIPVDAPGQIFRVRGSNVGFVGSGDKFKIASNPGVWDVTQPPGFGGRDQFNRGKSIVEFVLDAGGVTPIEIGDDLEISDLAFSPTLLRNVYSLGFLRVKLSEPTLAGSGAVGTGEELVLFRADRITVDSNVLGDPTGTEFDEGRLFDPDRSGTGPHRTLFDGQLVMSDYAGATYSWTINYFEGLAGDGILDDSVVLSSLVVSGTPGDYDGDGLDAKDIDAVFANLGTVLPLETAQNSFDLNGDDLLNSLDAQQWVTHPGFANTAFGDLDLNGMVDTTDRNTLLSNLNMPGDFGWADGDLNGDRMVTDADLAILNANFSGAGDFNGDGMYDCQDINALTAEISGMANNAAFDLTGDGVVDTEDRDAWLAEAGAANLASGNPFLLGDANLDGVVDVSDFNLWNGSKFTSIAEWCAGDFNADGVVDVSDFNLWNGNKFQSSLDHAAPTVPEPAGLLIGLVLSILGAQRLRDGARRR